MTRDRHIYPKNHHNNDTMDTNKRHRQYDYIIREITDLLDLQIDVIDRHQRKISTPDGELLLEEIRIRALALLYTIRRHKL